MYQKIRRFNRRLLHNRREHTRRLRLLSRHPFMVPIVAFVVLVALTSGILWLVTSHGISLKPPATDIVIISYDHQTRTVPSHEPTVGKLLAKLNIVINPGDVVEPALGTPIHQDDFRINIFRAVPVKIIDGNQTTSAFSAATTPRSIVEQAGLTIYPEDKLTPQPVTNILQQGTLGNIIVVTPATPVTLVTNGFVAATRTQAKTVGGFLVSQHVTLDKNVTVEPSLDTPIVAGETISIIRNGYSVQNVTQAIATPTQDIDDASLTYGTYAIRQVGSPGQEVLTYKVNVENGQVVSRTLIQTVVTIQPVTQIEVVGSNLSGIKGDMALAGISPGDYQYADYIISHESGWCPTKAEGEHYCPAVPDDQYTPYGYGLCQATPGYKMASAGADWATNPVTQLFWCSSYAQGRYGGWYGAYSHWLAYGSW
ncbi:MAG: ubiquitin-like domain-containing protein [Candidatus Saccharimonadales bacterium]